MLKVFREWLFTSKNMGFRLGRSLVYLGAFRRLKVEQRLKW